MQPTIEAHEQTDRDESMGTAGTDGDGDDATRSRWTGSAHHRYVRFRYLLESRRRRRRLSHEGTVVRGGVDGAINTQ